MMALQTEIHAPLKACAFFLAHLNVGNDITSQNSTPDKNLRECAAKQVAGVPSVQPRAANSMLTLPRPTRRSSTAAGESRTSGTEEV